MAGRTEISEQQAEFLEWLVTPPEGRNPSSQNEWARQHGLATQTVVRWKNHDAVFRAAWEKRMVDLGVGPEPMQDILNALRLAAGEGDVQAAKAYIAWVEKISPPKKAEQDAAAIEDMTDDEFADMLEGLIALREAARGTPPASH